MDACRSLKVSTSPRQAASAQQINQALSLADTYKDGEKYHQIIPEVRFIDVGILKKRDSGEIAEVSGETAEKYKKYLDEPIDVSAFRDGELQISNGHHRYASAKCLGIKWLPVHLQAINARGQNVRALIDRSREIEREISTKSFNQGSSDSE